MDAGTTNGVDLGELAFAVTKLTIRVDGWISELSCLPSSAQLINAPSVDSNLTSNASLKTSILQSRSGPVLSLNTPLSPTPPVRHRQSARQAFLAPATHQPAGRGRGAEILEELSLSPVASHRIWSHSLPRKPPFYAVSVAHSHHRARHHPNPPTGRLSRPDQKKTQSTFIPSHARRTCSTEVWGSRSRTPNGRLPASRPPSPHRRGTRSVCALRPGEARASPQVLPGAVGLRRFRDIFFCERWASRQVLVAATPRVRTKALFVVHGRRNGSDGRVVTRCT